MPTTVIKQLPIRPAWPGVTIDCAGPLLDQPTQQPPGHVVQYGHGAIMQVSPTQVAMLVSRRVGGVAVIDFADGFEMLVFDRLEDIHCGNLQPGLTNTDAIHPRSGMPLTMVHHIPRGGFVPLGAKLADGSPHPHAGTGFGVGVLHGYPKDNSRRDAHVAADLHSYIQLVQFAFDGHRLAITNVENLCADQLIPGHHTFGRGLSGAVADGEDLLVGMVAGQENEIALAHAQRLQRSGRKPYRSAKAPVGECYGPGLARFRRGNHGWQCVDFTQVPTYGPDMASEPSVIRDRDGSILMSVRGFGANVPPGESDQGVENTFEHFRVYRSADNGRTWDSIIHLPQMRAPTPVTVNQTAGGDVFLAANPYRPLEHDMHGRPVMKMRYRDQLWLWPLSADRRRVGEPFQLLNCSQVLGEPRDAGGQNHDNRWFADHPVSSICRLADGRLHTLLSFRVIDAATTAGGCLPEPRAGAWLAQLHCQQEAHCPWRF
jgi:hypothetical protein